MPRIRVHRKGYYRKDGTYVSPTDYWMEDLGEPGRTPESEQWFEEGRETGWRKTQKASTRRWHLLNATDRRLTMHDRYVQAGRMANQLANITVDAETEELARADANYFFSKAERTP